ncbi:phosphoribosyltransferase [Patescibacteria group bacterium]
MNPVIIEEQEYLYPNWQKMGEITVSLANKIKESEKIFDRVVALAKGGLSWNRQLQDLLNIKNASSIQVRFYKGINNTQKRPIVVQSLPVTIEDEDILIFDDIADTGESLKMAKEYLLNHGAKSIKTATMFEKPWSSIKPDYFGEKTEAWVIFPHDAVENIMLLKKKWDKIGQEEFEDRIKQIGIDESIIKSYLASTTST